MTEELRQAFRLYDKEQAGYISTAVLKVIYRDLFSLSCIINIPSVAKAVLQTPSSLTDPV